MVAPGFWSATACSKSIKRVTGMPSVRPVSRRWSNGPGTEVPGPWDGELSQDRLFYVATSQLGRQREEGGDGRTKW